MHATLLGYLKLSHLYIDHLCISQFHLCPVSPPPAGYCWAIARLVSPRILANFALPWSWAFANPGTTPAPSFWHACEVVSYPNKTAKRILKACSQFYTCISSLLIKPVKLGAIDVNHCFFGRWIKFLLILFEEHPFIFMKLFRTIQNCVASEYRCIADIIDCFL